MSFAPRVMINAGRPAGHRPGAAGQPHQLPLAVAGPEPAVQRYRAWAEAELAQPGVRGVRLETLDSGRPEMRQTLDRAGKFLNLVALLAALLSAVAVALAARGFAAGHLDDCAMLRVLGLPQRRIAGAYVTEFALMGLCASVAGRADRLGRAPRVRGPAGRLGGQRPARAQPVAGAVGLGIGLTLLVAFGLPPVLQLAQVPPLRVLRRDVGALKPASLAVLALGVAGFAALLLAVSADLCWG
jgi:putative ABC transport system permease protein